jgi:F-type H+-transporting ATPase subunit b
MAEAARALGLDPAVLALQAVAFIILFLVLRRYLFRPLLAVMAKREEEIAAALEAGERAKAELSRIDEERSRVLAGAREEGRQQVRQAVQEGEQARERILAEAREEVQALRERARRGLALEREEAELALRRQVVDLALLAADRAVLQRLDPEAHRRAVDDFITSLEGQR